MTTAPARLDLRPGVYHHINPTKRGWLFLGEQGGPCDKACKFCYYAFQKNLVFFDFDTLLAHANLFRHYYGLGYCDISGGEATIYGPMVKGRRPQLEALVRHCADIGLAPTIITHGQNNTPELVGGVEDAGLEDWLISIHGMEHGHDAAVVDHRGNGVGGWAKLTANLRHCSRPVRFNTTVTDFNYKELPDLALWLADHQSPTVLNLIQFNPFYLWGNKEVIEFQASMTDIAPYIGRAVELIEQSGWECNVRYFPYCVADQYGFARNCVNFYGTQYDHWEWALAATNKLQIKPGQTVEQLNRAWCDSIRQSRRNMVCGTCRFNPICEGPSEQYQKRFGLKELQPAYGAPVVDVAYFEMGGTFHAESQ